MPANRPGRGVGGSWWGREKQRHGSSCLPRARHSLSVRGLCFSALIIHFPETSWCEGLRHLPHGSPNLPVSSNICITPSPSTHFWQILQQHLLPEVCPMQASPSSNDRAGGQSLSLPSPSASSQLGVPGSSTVAVKQAWNRPGGAGGPRSVPPETSSFPSPSRMTPGDLPNYIGNLSWRTAIPTANTGRIRTQHMPFGNRNEQRSFLSLKDY